MECQKFYKTNLQERKEFVSINKLCWNCLSKAHFVRQCKSKKRCKLDKCGKHHSQLREPTPPDKKLPQKSKSQKLLVLVNSHHKISCHLQAIPV